MFFSDSNSDRIFLFRIKNYFDNKNRNKWSNFINQQENKEIKEIKEIHHYYYDQSSSYPWWSSYLLQSSYIPNPYSYSTITHRQIIQQNIIYQDGSDNKDKSEKPKSEKEEKQQNAIKNLGYALICGTLASAGFYYLGNCYLDYCEERDIYQGLVNRRGRLNILYTSAAPYFESRIIYKFQSFIAKTGIFISSLSLFTWWIYSDIYYDNSIWVTSSYTTLAGFTGFFLQARLRYYRKNHHQKLEIDMIGEYLDDLIHKEKETPQTDFRPMAPPSSPSSSPPPSPPSSPPPSYRSTNYPNLYANYDN